MQEADVAQDRNLIPSDIIRSARGFAILTIVKAGFLVSGRAGSGIVVARLSNGGWSAPSAIGTAGLGFGGQAGAELTECVRLREADLMPA